MAALIDLTNRQKLAFPDTFVPCLDPASGGINAKALFLFEKPGPMTDPANGGSGFISVHNDDRTAEATHGFLRRRNLPVDLCLFANVVPWWDGTRKVSREQRRAAGVATADLIRLMPRLRAVVLVGRTAQNAWLGSGIALASGIMVHCSDHPSPIVRARFPDRWAAIPSAWPDGQALTENEM